MAGRNRLIKDAVISDSALVKRQYKIDVLKSFVARTTAIFLLSTFCFFASLAAGIAIPEAAAKTKSLNLYYLHTGERAKITFKRNGKFVRSGLKKINRFLRDWRRNEPTKMDPKLLDLVWEIYKESGSRKPIHVISGYRSLKTNNILRKRGRGVAKKSQHTLGRALDFFLPDVKLSKLRRIALKKQRGGVGFYPRSGSPFVHVDTGNVRHWPKMSRRQLARIFPRGKTLHIPSDGRPLRGFKVAKANYQRQQKSAGRIRITKDDGKKKPTFFQRLAAKGADEEGDVSGNSTPGPRKVKARIVNRPKVIPTGSKAIPAPKPVSPPPAPVEVVKPEVLEPVNPVPVNPVPKEIVVAALEPKETEPLRIPVPRVAPRRPVAVAEIETPKVPAEVTKTEAETVFASLNNEEKPEEKTESNIFALAAETANKAKPVSRLSALTPTEIESLRTKALQNSIQSNIPETNPAKTEVVNGENTIEPSEPVKPVIVASLSPIEPEVSSDFKIAVPLRRPAALTTAAAEPVKETKRTVEVASLDPLRLAGEPKPSVSLIVKEVSEPVVEDNKVVEKLRQEIKKQTRQVASRGRTSIDAFDMVDLDDKITGKWSLKGDATIADIADIRPPAYGRNAIRLPSNMVLVDGFNNSENILKTSEFSGKAVQFLKFARFNKPAKTAGN